MVECEDFLECGRNKKRRKCNNETRKPCVKKHNGTNSRNNCNGNKHPSSDEEANALMEKLTRDFPDNVARSSSNASKRKEMSEEEEEESVHEQNEMVQDSSSSVVSTDSECSSPENMFSIGEVQIPDGDKKPAHEPALKKAPKPAIRTPKHKRAKGRGRKMTAEERAYQTAAAAASIDPDVQDQFTCASDTE